MDLTRAIDQIAAIRQQMARAETFGGYRAISTGLSGLIALVTAGVHEWFFQARNVYDVGTYLMLWYGAAMLSMMVVGLEMAWRLRKSQSSLQKDLTLAAVEQFLPFIVAGFLLTIVFVRFNYDEIWMLPPLWMILFGLGIHASRRVLPRFSSMIAGFYMMAGLAVLAARHDATLHAFTMGGVFGAGQLLAAGLLAYQERHHV
ncbi:MAG TPA: hypothetical protein VGB55_02725 [Tepidisphaeraceae bacterium]|jgi:hypothetical protein